MKLSVLIATILLEISFANSLYANPAPSQQLPSGGSGTPPEVKTTVSIGLTGITTIDIYCAYGKKKRPKHPQASGMIQVVLPNNASPLIAGDGAKRLPNQWIHDPDPLPQEPTGVVFTCGNSQELASGVYGFNWNAGWAPTPATCWSTPAFTPSVSGGIVVWNPDGKSGTIYIPKLKSTTVKVAPDDKNKPDEGRSRKEIGAGENVELVVENFPSPFHVDWQQSGNVDGIVLAHHSASNRCHATKPGASSASGTITAAVTSEWGDTLLEKTFTVFKPSGIKTRRVQIIPMPLLQVGAGMIIMVQVLPTKVSFNDIFVRELGDPGSPEVAPHAVVGYFSYILAQYGTRFLDHRALQRWLSPNEAENEYPDQCESGDPIWPPPIPYEASGSFHWEIPLLWEVDQTAIGDEYFRVNQEFALQANGTLTITKKEATITRGINETHGN